MIIDDQLKTQESCKSIKNWKRQVIKIIKLKDIIGNNPKNQAVFLIFFSAFPFLAATP